MKVLQFGTGVFLRGYFDWMLQQLANKGLADPEVTMVKLTPRGDLSAYENQNGEFHVILQGLDKGETVDKIEKIDRLKDFIHPYNQWGKFLESAKDEDFQLIVSNSTEAGLCYDKSDSYDESPVSFPAKLYAWLKTRFEAGLPGILVMACELVPDNGSQLKEILLKHSQDDSASEAFLSWMNEECTFINTLVDRIVSKVPQESIAALKTQWGVEDDLLLCAEPYHLLALDSEKLENVLPLQKAGLNIEVTDNLDSVRERKVKVLNGAHMLVVPAGLALNLTIVEETLEHEKLRTFAKNCLAEEVAPTISDPGIDTYINSVIERFENPFLKHRLENIALNSSAKIGQRLFPSIKDYFEESGRYPVRLLTAVAVFLEFYKGEIVEAGIMNTAWGTLSDNADAMTFLNSLHEKSGDEAARSITETQFWPVRDNMKDTFIMALGEVIENVRANGVEKSLEV